MNFNFVISVVIIITVIQAVKADVTEQEDEFYSYVLSKGVSIKKLSENDYRISHGRWRCEVDTSVAKQFTKQNVSWKDMFETRIDMLSDKTKLPPHVLCQKMGVLPEDGTPVILVARQGNVSIPKENVIIRLNNHGPLDARTTMTIAWASLVRTVINSARRKPNREIITWFHHGYYGLWNTSKPLVIPESIWDNNRLKYYRGPLFFMKGKFAFGNFSKCTPDDGIGLGALNRIAHLKGDISTLGFSTGADKYNMAYTNRFKLLSHKLVWSYYVVKELTDTVQTK